MQMIMDILAIIPAYNEASHIGRVVAGVCKRLPVLVVDDGSNDDTGKLAATAGGTVLRQDPNQGKGKALRAGFQWALDHGFSAAITLDADGQHDPEDLPAFLQAYLEGGADLIIGARDFSQIPRVRRVANTLGRWIFSWSMGRVVLDNQSGYRLVSRRMMQAALDSTEHGFQFEVEMILICIQKGFRLEWVPIRTIYAGERSHIKPVQHLLEFTGMALRARRQMRVFYRKLDRGR
jgi:glycosyltransferase involved in cell wall biosynthesis